MTEETIFGMAVEKSTSAERTAFLYEVCHGDEALRVRVEALLKSHFDTHCFLNKPAVKCAVEEIDGGPGAELTQGEPLIDSTDSFLEFLEESEQAGSLGRFGHFEIIDVIGRGGMGIVFKAIDDNLQRVVAVKVMTAQLVASASHAVRGPRRRCATSTSWRSTGLRKRTACPTW